MQPPKSKPLWLALIRQLQANGQPDKWSLFLAHEQEPGLLYELRTKECDNNLAYLYEAPVGKVHLPSPGHTWSMYTMRSITNDEAKRVHEVAGRQPIQGLDSGSDGRDFVSASQRWVENIIEELVEEGVLEPRVLKDVRSMMGPSRLSHFKSPTAA
ncbi:hypothetical protein BDV10DRAFT_186908 [Aspergillus recurvatus]